MLDKGLSEMRTMMRNKRRRLDQHKIHEKNKEIKIKFTRGKIEQQIGVCIYFSPTKSDFL